jgi:hypothetical protein
MVIADSRKPKWFFYPAWVALSSISIPIAFAIYWALIYLAKEAVGSTILVGGQPHITEDFLLPYFLWPALGLVTGFLQYLLLRCQLPRIRWWIAAMTFGWSLGLIGGRVLYRTLYGTLDVSATWFETLTTALVGGAMGLAQWVVLHQRVRHAAWWILANALSWGVVGRGAATLTNQMVISAVGIVLVPGIATSIVLWLLLDRLQQREGSGRNTPPNKSPEPTHWSRALLLPVLVLCRVSDCWSRWLTRGRLGSQPLRGLRRLGRFQNGTVVLRRV